MFVLVDHKVDVIGHDGASVASVTFVVDHLRESNGNLITRFGVELQHLHLDLIAHLKQITWMIHATP